MTPMIKVQLDMSTKLISKVYNCLNSIQFILLPGTCILCKKPSRRKLDICLACADKLPIIAKPCLRCALPLPQGDHSGSLCGSCLTLEPPFHFSVSAFDYLPPLNTLIGDFKYHAKLHNGRVLSNYLLSAIQDFYQHRQLPELILPVPLHKRKLRQRGYNQAIEIGRYLAKHLNIPMRNNLCIRQKDTQAQMRLSASARQNNLHNAFSLCNTRQLSHIKSVAIVDDVITTMATTAELSKLLLANDVQEVHIWSLARTCKSDSEHWSVLK